MDLRNSVNEIEELYNRINKLSLQSTEMFIEYVKLLESLEVIDSIDKKIDELNANSSGTGLMELDMLKKVKSHYASIIQLKEKINANTIAKYAKFVDHIAAHPGLFPTFDFNLAYDVICPRPPPIPRREGGKAKKSVSKEKSKKKTVSKEKKKAKAV